MLGVGGNKCDKKMQVYLKSARDWLSKKLYFPIVAYYYFVPLLDLDVIIAFYVVYFYCTALSQVRKCAPFDLKSENILDRLLN